MAVPTDISDETLEVSGVLGVAQPAMLAPFPAAIFGVIWPPPAGWDLPTHRLISAPAAVSLVTKGPDWLQQNASFEVTLGQVTLKKTSASAGAGTFRSDTRTRISFWVGSTDIVESAQGALPIAGVPYVYAGGFDADGIAACSTFVTEAGLVTTLGQFLEITELFNPLVPSSAAEHDQVSLRPGLVISAAKEVFFSGAAGFAGDNMEIAFTVNGGAPSLRLKQSLIGPKEAIALDWHAEGGVDASSDSAAFILQSTAGVPAANSGWPGELQYKYVEGGDSLLFLRLENGSWNAFSLS